MAIKERLRLPLYDTIPFFCNGTGTLSSGAQTPAALSAGYNPFFFVVGQGGSANGYVKTYNDTNLQTSGQMPYSKYVVVGIRLYFYTRMDGALYTTAVAPPVLLTDINLIQNNSFVLYQRQNRDVLRVPTSWIPSGIGLFNGGNTNTASNGMPTLSNLYKILPETYSQTDTIQLSIQTTSAITLTNNVYCCAMLEGIVDKNF